MDYLKLKPVELAPGKIDSAWQACQAAGYSAAELSNNPELLAFIAKTSGIEDFRKIPAHAKLIIPEHQSLQQVVSLVQSHPDFYRDAMVPLKQDLETWLRSYTVKQGMNPSLTLSEPKGGEPAPLPTGQRLPPTAQAVAASASQLAAAPQTPTTPARRLAPTAQANAAVAQGAIPSFQAPSLKQMLPPSVARRMLGVLGSRLGIARLPAHTTTLEWNAPVSRTDGTPLTNLGGYTIYYGTSSRHYTTQIDVGNVTTFSISGLPPAHYYFAAKAYDTAGNFSNFSNEADKVIQ